MPGTREAAMVAPWPMLAEAASNTGFREWARQLLWAGPAIAGILLLMALVVAWVKKWRRRAPPELLTPSDQLAHFRTLYERGELSADEFARVRGLLVDRVKREAVSGAVAVDLREPSAQAKASTQIQEEKLLPPQAPPSSGPPPSLSPPNLGGQ